MFRALGKQTAESTEGIRVSSNGRHGIRYQEKDRVLELNTEGMRTSAGEYGDLVYLPRNARWLPPYERTVLDAEHLLRIEQHIREAFAVLRTPVMIEHC